MACSNHSMSTRPSSRGPNCLAIVISCAVIAIMSANFQPIPVGANAMMTRAEDDARMPTPPPPPPSVATGQEASGQTAGEQEGATGTSSQQANGLTGRMALQYNLLMMENGCLKWTDKPHYTATFYKQERLNGEISEEQKIVMKIRHSPFSVYMKWLTGDKGRECLYVEGENDGKMLVRVGGIKGRFLPLMKLDPTGALAMAECRYPITKAGLLALAQTVAEYRRHDLEQPEGVKCYMVDDQEYNGRPCSYFCIEYTDRQVGGTYRKSEMYIDKEITAPVCVRNFGWPDEGVEIAADELDDATLLEYYRFGDIDTEHAMADNAFDVNNKDYRFVRR